jgi:hypothetical protein
MPERARAEWEAALPKLDATLDQEGRALARAIAIGPSRDALAAGGDRLRDRRGGWCLRSISG